MSKASTCLWFGKDAEMAVRFYVSLLPGSSLTPWTTRRSGGPHHQVRASAFGAAVRLAAVCHKSWRTRPSTRLGLVRSRRTIQFPEVILECPAVQCPA